MLSRHKVVDEEISDTFDIRMISEIVLPPFQFYVHGCIFRPPARASRSSGTFSHDTGYYSMADGR